MSDNYASQPQIKQDSIRKLDKNKNDQIALYIIRYVTQDTNCQTACYTTRQHFAISQPIIFLVVFNYGVIFIFVLMLTFVVMLINEDALILDIVLIVQLIFLAHLHFWYCLPLLVHIFSSSSYMIPKLTKISKKIDPQRRREHK